MFHFVGIWLIINNQINASPLLTSDSLSDSSALNFPIDLSFDDTSSEWMIADQPLYSSPQNDLGNDCRFMVGGSVSCGSVTPSQSPALPVQALPQQSLPLNLHKDAAPLLKAPLNLEATGPTPESLKCEYFEVSPFGSKTRCALLTSSSIQPERYIKAYAISVSMINATTSYTRMEPRKEDSTLRWARIVIGLLAVSCLLTFSSQTKPLAAFDMRFVMFNQMIGQEAVAKESTNKDYASRGCCIKQMKCQSPYLDSWCLADGASGKQECRENGGWLEVAHGLVLPSTFGICERTYKHCLSIHCPNGMRCCLPTRQEYDPRYQKKGPIFHHDDGTYNGDIS